VALIFISLKLSGVNNAIPIKIPNNSKSQMEHKRPQIAKLIFRKKNKAGDISLFDFKMYYKARIVRTVWYWHKDRHERPLQQNREPRNPCLYSQLIFEKSTKNIQ